MIVVSIIVIYMYLVREKNMQKYKENKENSVTDHSKPCQKDIPNEKKKGVRLWQKNK